MEKGGGRIGVFVGVILIIAMYYDIREYRIPNKCILIGLIGGLVLQIVTNGMIGIVYWAIGWLCVGMLFFPFSYLRMFGAADVKLFMVVGSCFSLRDTLEFAVVALWVGAVLSIGKMLRHRILFYQLRVLASYFYIIFANRKIMKYRMETSDSRGKENVLPFAVPMTIGYGIWLVMKKYGIKVN